MDTLAFLSLLALSVIAGSIYTALGLKARAHLTSHASESDRSVGWLFWWSCASQRYDSEGKRLCRIGNFLVLPLLAFYAAWYFLLLK